MLDERGSVHYVPIIMLLIATSVSGLVHCIAGDYSCVLWLSSIALYGLVVLLIIYELISESGDGLSLVTLD